MASARRNVLIMGLGRNLIPKNAEVAAMLGDGKSEAMVADSMKQASEAGFDCEDLYLFPKDLSKSLGLVREKFGSKHWDCVVIGWGVRGDRELTPLFEAAVNAAVELSPGIKFGFSTSPGLIHEAIQRAFSNSI